MRLALALGVAIAGFTAITASANQTEHSRVVVRHAAAHADMDANNDGWMSREESAAAADRLFDELDSNDDNRLTDDDRQHFEHDITVHVGPGAPPEVDGENCTRTSEGEGDNQRVTVICEGGDQDGAQTRTETRTVIIRSGAGGGEWTEHNGGHIAPIPPVPPVPPVPHMFMMMIGDDSEADLNSDGALSREEFRAQHQRFFDARDANGDGRVRMPRSPEPPAPPAAPEPPRRR